MHTLTKFERPQVKAVLENQGTVYLATEIGVYRLEGQTLVALSTWHNRSVQQVTAMPSGFLVLLEEDDGQTLLVCDQHWEAQYELPRPQGEKIKCLYRQENHLLAGTKSGLFKLPLQPSALAEDWQCLFRDPAGFGEVLWINSHGVGHLRASIKKLGVDAKPALIETLDNAISWHVEMASDYQDLILAADDEHCISRWQGYRHRHTRAGYKKHPISAGYLNHDHWAVLDGDKLEYQQQGHALVSFKHPSLAEAERLYPLPQQGGFLVAGVQGAFLVSPSHGQVIDLFAGQDFDKHLGKLKRIFTLDDDVLLATATYGTFRSTDAGHHWQPVTSEWAVLDAEHLLRSTDGRWWLGCQRGLFVSNDNGLCWHYVKFKLAELPHYSELRGGLAISGQQLFIGSKTGLWVAPLAQPDAISRVAAFGTAAIELLHQDPNDGRLLIGTVSLDEDQLWCFDPQTARVQALATPGQLSLFEAQVVGTVNDCLIATDEHVYRVLTTPDHKTSIQEITPKQGVGNYGLMALNTESCVLWDTQHAWCWHHLSSSLDVISDWPKGIRHACLRQQGILTTDRRQLALINLPPITPEQLEECVS